LDKFVAPQVETFFQKWKDEIREKNETRFGKDKAEMNHCKDKLGQILEHAGFV
jgi:hypothetical protein